MATKSSSCPLPSTGTLSITRKCKDDVPSTINPINAMVDCPEEVITNNSPTPVISLARGRFAPRVLLPLSVFVCLLSFFARGVTIHKNVRDFLGSSREADSLVAFYQVANGLISTVVGTVFDGYVVVFIVVARTYLQNLRWIHDPRGEPSRFKRLVLWLLCPAVMYNMHIAVTSMFVSHTTTCVIRNFSPDDLLAPRGNVETTVFNTVSASNFTARGNGVSVMDTILRGAVLQKVTPFKMDPNSTCMLVNATAGRRSTELPTVKEVRSTAVVYGFPTRYWNVDLLPFGLKTSQSFTCTLDNGNVSSETHSQFQDFLEDTDVTWLTMYESLLQGKLLFERSVSDSQRCQNNLLSDTIDACTGAQSSLDALANITDPAIHNADDFLSTVVIAFLVTTPEIEPESANLTIEVYEINPQLKLTAMTLDMPYYIDREYRNTNQSCVDSKLRPEVLEDYQKKGLKIDAETLRHRICDRGQYAYENPRGACGRTSCVFVDQSGTISFKKQLQLMPYITNCSTEQLIYDEDFRNSFPSGCEPVANTAFLYGLGTYIAGDEFDSGSETGFPFISNPRRRIVLTFAKLEWTFQNISEAFDAECGVHPTQLSTLCSGLLYDLANVTVPAVPTEANEPVYKRMLVLGEGLVPMDFKLADYRTPVQLLSLNSRPFFYPKSQQFYEWEYLNPKHFKLTNWPETVDGRGGLPGNSCSPLVDSYISMVETNNYFMDDPRQPLYTSALFYLFQNAALKTVKGHTAPGSASSIGTTTFVGDLVEHTIMLKIPVMSLILTFAGLALLRALTIMATVTSAQRLRMTEDTDENVARKYARFRQDDEYPSEVFDRGLKLRGSQHRLPMDQCAVESLTVCITSKTSDTGNKLIL